MKTILFCSIIILVASCVTPTNGCGYARSHAKQLKKYHRHHRHHSKRI